jgi:hypothetical protein
MKKTLTGKRAMDRTLAENVAGRGERRRIRREVLAAQKAARKVDCCCNPNVRPPIVIKVKRGRNYFTPGSVGHKNAVILGQLRVAREIDQRGPREAVKTGHGDRKRRRFLSDGIANTTTLSKSWSIYYRLFTKEAREEISREAKAEQRRASRNPVKRGLQWLKDRAGFRGK